MFIVKILKAAYVIRSSDVWYEIFFILPITIIAQQIYHDTIIIMICNSSPVWIIVEPQMTQNILQFNYYYPLQTLVNGLKQQFDH